VGVNRSTARIGLVLGLAALSTSLVVCNCGPAVGRPAVSLSIARAPKTPQDASVTIDEEYIGPLYYVAARGVRLPVGQHRITVEKEGYFPWDRLVEADRQPIRLEVRLVRIPD
jgi:hypothetical protein